MNTCDECGAELDHDRRFCDKDCYGDWLSDEYSGDGNPMSGHSHTEEAKQSISEKNSTEPHTYFCDWCGDYNETTHNRNARFCDNKCFGNWLSEHLRQPQQDGYPPEFDEQLKSEVRKRDDYRCQQCLTPQYQINRLLDVHHTDGDKTNCKKKNLISLCRSCHISLEMDRRSHRSTPS